MRNVFFVQQISTLEWFLSNDAENFNLHHRNELHFKIENTIFQLKLKTFQLVNLHYRLKVDRVLKNFWKKSLMFTKAAFIKKHYNKFCFIY